MPKKIDANRASAAELQKVQGIGPELSAAIVEYREQYGPFRTPEDLINVAGIGRKNLAGLMEEGLTVEPTESSLEALFGQLAPRFAAGLRWMNPEARAKLDCLLADAVKGKARLEHVPLKPAATPVQLASGLPFGLSTPPILLGPFTCALLCFLGCKLSCTTICKAICAGGCAAGCLAGCAVGCQADTPAPGTADAIAGAAAWATAQFGADVTGDAAGNASPTVVAAAIGAAGTLPLPLP